MSDGLSGGGSGLPVAGWYPDPAGTPQERWWGGLDWTDHLRDIPASAPIYPQAALAAPSTPVWPATAPAAPVAPVYQPMASWDSGGAQAQYNPALAQYYTTSSGSPNTVPIWLIATYPIPLVLAEVWVRTLPLDLYLAAALGVSGGFLALIIGAVLWDFFTLRGRGLPAASPAWVLLTAIGYLIARRVVLRRGGVSHSAPGNVFVLCLLAGGIGFSALFTLGSGSQEALAVQKLETQMEAGLLAETSQQWTVTCPTDVRASVPGTEFECSATSATGLTVPITFKVIAPYQFDLAD